MQILTYETMPENTDLTNAKAVRRVHCNSRTYTKLFDIRRRVCIQRLTCNSICVQFLTQFRIPLQNCINCEI